MQLCKYFQSYASFRLTYKVGITRVNKWQPASVLRKPPSLDIGINPFAVRESSARFVESAVNALKKPEVRNFPDWTSFNPIADIMEQTFANKVLSSCMDEKHSHQTATNKTAAFYRMYYRSLYSDTNKIDELALK